MTATLNRILYVEDEPDIQTIARIALETVGGFTVEICSSGGEEAMDECWMEAIESADNEALEKVDGFAPDLILLDVMMPDMDGPTTMHALRSQTSASETPIIFITAKVQTQEVESYKALGAIDVIAKPFDPMTLSSKIQDIWSKAHE